MERTELDKLDLQYKNALATAEYYRHILETQQQNNTVGSKIGKKIDKCLHKLSWPSRYYKNKKKCRAALKFNEEGINRGERRDKRLIISLTSYPDRINAVPATISSLLNQTIKPDKIILWLGEEKFPNKKLPVIFNKLVACGVNVEFRPDLKSHTKYFYAIQEYPEDLIITVDDDLLYRNTLVEELYTSYLKYPDCVSALRVHRMRFNDDGTIKHYNEWDYEYSGEIGTASHQYFATGVGGVLYPSHTLHEEVTNLINIQTYCHNHDDFWLKIMEVMNGTKVVLAAESKKENGGTIMGTQFTGQWRENVIGGGNERQSEAVLSVYNEWYGSNNKLTDIMAYDI